MPFLVPCCDAEAILWKKKFCPSHLGWRGNMEKFWSWLLRSWLQRPRSQWLGQPSLWNEHIYILYEKRWLWQSEISEIEPAQLTGLIWRGPKFRHVCFDLRCVPPNYPISACGATSSPGHHSFPKWAITVQGNSRISNLLISASEVCME